MPNVRDALIRLFLNNLASAKYSRRKVKEQSDLVKVLIVHNYPETSVFYFFKIRPLLKFARSSRQSPTLAQIYVEVLQRLLAAPLFYGAAPRRKQSISSQDRPSGCSRFVGEHKRAGWPGSTPNHGLILHMQENLRLSVETGRVLRSFANKAPLDLVNRLKT
jgi:hypothetical protein